MKTIKIGNYSIYSDGWYNNDSEFTKLYKGIRVNLNPRYDYDPNYMSFSIRTKKKKICIWKHSEYRLDKLIFKDSDCSITCECTPVPTDKYSPMSLCFEQKVYDELKENVPEFFKEQGWNFDTKVTDSGIELYFVKYYDRSGKYPLDSRLFLSSQQ